MPNNNHILPDNANGNYKRDGWASSDVPESGYKPPVIRLLEQIAADLHELKSVLVEAKPGEGEGNVLFEPVEDISTADVLRILNDDSGALRRVGNDDQVKNSLLGRSSGGETEASEAAGRLHSGDHSEDLRDSGGSRDDLRAVDGDAAFHVSPSVGADHESASPTVGDVPDPGTSAGSGTPFGVAGSEPTA